MICRNMVVCASLLLAGCSTHKSTQALVRDPPATRAFPMIAGAGGLPEFFDCLRANDAVVLSAHRGGPVPGFPENALETMDHTVSQVPAILEIDVERTADGVLVLMHDPELERTTTGQGKVGEMKLADLSNLRLVDNQAAPTDFLIPTLDAALAWSKGRAMLVLDRKGATTYEDLVAATMEHEAFGRVLFATYSLDDAIHVSRLAGDAMIVTPLEDLEDVKTLSEAGLDLEHILYWGGTEVPAPDFYAALAEMKIESAFAPLGWWTGSWDSRISMLGDDTLYLRITRGVQLVATDRVREVAAVLPGVPRAEVCVGRPPTHGDSVSQKPTSSDSLSDRTG